MAKKERDILCKVLKNVKMPDDYASNISRCVNLKECKISGLKSHDSHILIECMLPLALWICDSLQQVTSIMIELSALCSKVLDVNELIVMARDGMNISNDIMSLGIGPNKVAKRFSGFIINGIKFHTLARKEQRLTQNSGVVNDSEVEGVNYYGRIKDIIKLNYYGAFKVVMFKCDWFDVYHNAGVKQDEYGFTLGTFLA
ncbi:hypothetical protein GH714_034523 [Hevea brasiliensis]|uniref:DUF4216 domain-containing protein n=1 Tax=Hevea brasiliensis TaxID=3981 RepID=A0A6A6LLN3_HEVBR|nr:hypothetical protein GH714_034523 [Hevea brasiliensis]